MMLRLTKSGKRKYVSLGLSVEERFWDFKKNTPKRNCPDRDAILAVIERKSKQYREQITQFKVEGKDYTLETLVQRVENPVRQMNFGEYLDYFIQQLREENRLGYAESFKGLKSSLILYCNNLDGLKAGTDKGGRFQNNLEWQSKSIHFFVNFNKMIIFAETMMEWI